MRKFLFVLALTAAVAGVAVPATAKNAKHHAKPTGEQCIQRAQAANLSPNGTAAATAACAKYAGTVADARTTLRAARATRGAAMKAAKAEFRADRTAAATQSADLRKAAMNAARAERRAATRAARQTFKAAHKAYHATVKAARQDLRTELRAARAD